MRITAKTPPAEAGTGLVSFGRFCHENDLSSGTDFDTADSLWVTPCPKEDS